MCFCFNCLSPWFWMKKYSMCMGVVQEWWREKLKNTRHGKSRDLCTDCDSSSVHSQSTQILYAKKNVILCELGYGGVSHRAAAPMSFRVTSKYAAFSSQVCFSFKLNEKYS